MSEPLPEEPEFDCCQNCGTVTLVEELYNGWCHCCVAAEDLRQYMAEQRKEASP